MLQLEAICLGYAVPRRDFDAEIHSVFHSAANLRLPKSRRLLTLLTTDQADLPQGIRLNAPPGFSFDGLRVGAAVACRDGLLLCEPAALSIDLRPARRWKCNLPALAAHLSDPSTLAGWQKVARRLDQRRLRMADGLPAGQLAASRRMDAILPDLLSATRHYDLAARGLVANLIGLGSGLTPTGDDFLVGYLAGLWSAAGGSEQRRAFISAVGKAIVRLSRQTNDISRTYLFHAARGQVSSCLSALSEAICHAASADRLQAAAEAALNVGHSSGVEAVAGLLIGLSAWSGDLPSGE